MFDETAKFKRSKTNPETLQEQVRQVSQSVQQAVDLLLERQELLRPQAMSLPTSSLENMRWTRKELDTLSKQLIRAQSELNQLRGLAETSALITSTLELSDVLNQVIDRVIELTGAERGYIVLKSETTGELEFRVARGLDRADLADEDFVISRTIVDQVATTGESLLTESAKDDDRFKEGKSIVNLKLLSILAVPLKDQKGETIGVVYCDNSSRVALFREHERNLLQAFANQAAVAIQNARLFEKVRAQLDEISSIRDLMDNVFSSIISGLITLNRNDMITAYNAAAEQIIGVSAMDALGKPLEKVLPLLDDEFREKVEAARQLPAQQQIELEISFQNPETRYWKVKLSALRDGAGLTEGVAMVLDDVTNIKEEEERLREAEAYLPQALIQRLRSLDIDITKVDGEERIISALFADVRGFTSFSEKLEPEALMEIINEYLSRASDAIELFEGVVDKYMGDAVTGLFNTQLNPQEDHALRVVRAAVSMLYDVDALHETLPEDQRLFYGVGIHTGIAVLGSIGSQDRREFSAIGEALEISKLLQENALGGEIILSEATYELVKDYFEFEAMEPRKTKGRTDLAVVYRLTGIRKRSGVVAPVGGSA
jgi:PAS domain S-box-containing protein